MRTAYWLVLLTIAVLATAFFVNRRESDGTAAATLAKVAIEGVAVGTVKDLMKGIVDPSAAIVWDAVGTEHRRDGTIEKEPKTDEEWARVEYSALALAESASLLKIEGRRIARPEESNTTRWPDAPELTPLQIEERLTTSRLSWDRSADALQAAAMKAMTAARSRDKDGVFNVGEEIDNACESCHIAYWYPATTPAAK